MRYPLLSFFFSVFSTEKVSSSEIYSQELGATGLEAPLLREINRELLGQGFKNTET